ncbi:hypothetical protein Tcan_01963 [Toxocara canis]|uniref:Uncharacterized protein n=1 Tax=Toxocara canis TaxID=6265 RepID=A0A0B2UNJ2_TOXCA|nr:hypothetical protein Tcan_01963 [Toxocara canis]
MRRGPTALSVAGVISSKMNLATEASSVADDPRRPSANSPSSTGECSLSENSSPTCTSTETITREKTHSPATISDKAACRPAMQHRELPPRPGTIKVNRSRRKRSKPGKIR